MCKWDVLTFGEPLVNFVAEEVGDIRDVTRFRRMLGGAEINVAVGLSRLERRALLVTQLGQDILGDYTLAALQRERVDTSFIKLDETATTGYQFKTKVDAGDPQIYYFRRGSAASRIAWYDELDEAVRQSAHVHLTGIPPALSASARDLSYCLLASANRHHTPVSFDPNLRPGLWASHDEMVEVVNQLAVQAQIVMPGLAEGRMLTGFKTPEAIADFYLDKGVRLVVVKLGPDGAYLKNEREEYTVSGFKTEAVVDTVGAGDGFAVGLIDAIIQQTPVHEAVSQGCAVGAMAVMSVGDYDGYPTRTELINFMNVHSRRLT